MPTITNTTSQHRAAAVKRAESIKAVLDKLYVKYNHRGLIKPDPLQFVYHYSRPADMEIAGLLASSLAYGRVKQIEKSLNDLFGRMGASPYGFVMSFDKAGRKKLNSFKHRFTTGQDISDLLSVLKKVLRQKGSIEKHFSSGYNKADENILPALSRFCDSLYDIYSEQTGRKVSSGMKYLLASPVRGSACKRLNLFLRWMVRDDEVDAGLWKHIDKAKLVVPIDVHMGRLCRILGFHNRKVISLSTAREITERFAEIEPTDPVKYDFALSRIGILDNCTGRRRSGCECCELFKFCFHK
ncbi:MAG: TIGR02757 family protein [Phycisphaerae bacterium]|nr:TIGR02757 family protein [Phycisphaerae bacterium]MDD5380081.1 TIGR02757 family protein [Phycisphaerae bacterium]